MVCESFLKQYFKENIVSVEAFAFADDKEWREGGGGREMGRKGEKRAGNEGSLDFNILAVVDDCFKCLAFLLNDTLIYILLHFIFYLIGYTCLNYYFSNQKEKDKHLRH